MNALVRKEIRLLMPAWIAALALVVVPESLVWLATRHKANPVPDPALFVLYGLGVVLIGLSSFGQEFNCGTFPLLLAQPVSRVRLWRVKVLTLAAAMLSVSLIFLLGFRPEPLGALGPSEKELLSYSGLICCAVAGCALAGGLWTTLLLRQVAAAFWFTLLAPGVICVALGLPLPEGMRAPFMLAALGLYALAGFYWARHLFLGAQDVQWTGGDLSIPSWIVGRSLAEPSISRSGFHPVRALLRKEIQSHHVSLLVAALFLGVHVGFVVLRKASPAPEESGTLITVVMVLFFILWFALPFLFGSVTVAEERKLGTLEGQLCLPVRRSVQFVLKCSVAIVFSVLFCAVMPWLVEGAAVTSGMRGQMLTSALLAQDLAILAAVAATATLVSLFASCLARNVLQAMGAAVGIGCALAAAIALAISEPSINPFNPLWGWPLIGYIGLPVVVLTLVWAGFDSFRHLHLGWRTWFRSLFTLCLSLLFAFTATAIIYHRPWERLMTVEPLHGPARLSGLVRPEICSSFGKLFVLLPDGRLWVSTRHRMIETGCYSQTFFGGTSRVDQICVPAPTAGDFLEASDWVGLAHCYRRVIGLKRDGTLWTVFQDQRTNSDSLPRPQQIGADKDWKAVAAGSGFFLALKINGALWGWGNNREGQLGPGPTEFTNEFVRVGKDSDWTAVFAAGQSSIGVKRDGSVWKWGAVPRGPGGRQAPLDRVHAEPVRWDLNGSDWIALAGEPSCDLALHADGTLWASGLLPQNLLGTRYAGRFAASPLRVGNRSDWSAIKASGRRLLAIRRNGTLLENDVYATSFFGVGLVRHPSKYSDWIAVGSEWSDPYVALAADGTLCCWWGPPEMPVSHPPLLGPTRRPLWSLNLLANAP